MRSPAAVFAGKERDKVLAFPVTEVAAVCTMEAGWVAAVARVLLPLRVRATINRNSEAAGLAPPLAHRLLQRFSK